MKVLHVVSIAYEVGGAEVTVKHIQDAMHRQGHEVLVLSTDKNAAGKDVFADMMMPAVSGGGLVRLLGYFWNHGAYRTIRAVIRDFAPDLVHLHTMSEFSPSLLWGLGKTPTVMTVHGPEEFTLELLPWFLAPSDYKYGSYRREDMRVIGWLRYAYLRYMQRPAYRLGLRRLKLVMVPSKFMARAVSVDFPRTPIVHIYPGIKLPPSIPLPHSSLPVVLYVGRLEAVKGVNYLIKAFSHVHRVLPEARLHIVGDGSQREALESATNVLGLSGIVEFVGHVKPEQIHQEYAAASLVAIPSVCPDNLPVVGLEALGMGRPIVGSNSGGIPEIIDEFTGVIVAPRDECGLASAICEMLLDRRKLADAAAASAVKAHNFSLDLFIENLLNIYQNVLGGFGVDRTTKLERKKLERKKLSS